jgi:hypothetical protein
MVAGGPHCAECRAVFSGKNTADCIDRSSGGLPGDFCRFRAEHCICFDTTAACCGKPAKFLEVICGMDQQQIGVRSGDNGATADSIQQPAAVQVLFKHGNSNWTFRVITCSVSLKRGIRIKECHVRASSDCLRSTFGILEKRMCSAKSLQAAGNGLAGT